MKIRFNFNYLLLIIVGISIGMSISSALSRRRFNEISEIVSKGQNCMIYRGGEAEDGLRVVHTFDGDYNAWAKLNLILEQVRMNYVDTIDQKEMTDAAVSAALAVLDPHSIYLPPVELSQADESLAGNFDGIGIQFNVPNDTAIVLSVIKGGPSEKSGLQQGDRLIKVDDRVIAGNGTPQDSMVRRFKGPSGTKVNLTVRRDGVDIPFTVTRGKIPVESVETAFMLDDTTGYMKLSKFTRSTFLDFVKAKDRLLAQGMKHLIFDLRGNTGGYFDQSYLLCNEFLAKDQPVVYMEGLHRKRADYHADGSGTLQKIGLSVLIDEGSASSSEIFAGAIQDNDRGVIIGRRSFGKGLVQEPVNFSDGSGLRLTVARFHTPSGRCIQKPYTENYAYDFYERYARGELMDKDSIKVDTSHVYRTVGGRTVYGGGGIIPDLFVPMDTTAATKFFIACNKKATMMRFASAMFDRYGKKLSQIDSFQELEEFLDRMDLAREFKEYAWKVDGLKPARGEWELTETYLMPQLRALVGRYSKLDNDAFYHFYLPIDKMVKVARESSDRVSSLTGK